MLDELQIHLFPVVVSDGRRLSEHLGTGHIELELIRAVEAPGATHARHSRKIADRPELGVSIFDSSAPISTGRAVYVTATGRRLQDDERIPAVAAFSHRAVLDGGRPRTVADLERPEGA